jgi:NAD(P)H-dependent FMN reductase
MKKILAFAGSTSLNSINKELAVFAAQNLTKTSFDIIDLNDFPLPIFSVDIEKEGFPESAKKFNTLLDNYDGFILSLAEHNGSYSAAFKNVFDWSSRIESNFFRDKPLLLMSTSPGGRGGASVLEAGTSKFSRMGAKELFSFSLPNFYENFKEGKIVHAGFLSNLKGEVTTFEKAL